MSCYYASNIMHLHNALKEDRLIYNRGSYFILNNRIINQSTETLAVVSAQYFH